MKLEFYPIEKLKKQILEIIGRYLDLEVYQIFFFGSRVTGKGNEKSDIDVGIEGPRPVPPKIMWQIEDEIENLPTLYKIEIVDFSQVSSKFKEVVKEQIEILN